MQRLPTFPSKNLPSLKLYIYITANTPPEFIKPSPSKIKVYNLPFPNHSEGANLLNCLKLSVSAESGISAGPWLPRPRPLRPWPLWATWWSGAMPRKAAPWTTPPAQGSRQRRRGAWWPRAGRLRPCWCQGRWGAFKGVIGVFRWPWKKVVGEMGDYKFIWWEEYVSCFFWMIRWLECNFFWMLKSKDPARSSYV